MTVNYDILIYRHEWIYGLFSNVIIINFLSLYLFTKLGYFQAFYNNTMCKKEKKNGKNTYAQTERKFWVNNLTGLKIYGVYTVIVI